MLGYLVNSYLVEHHCLGDVVCADLRLRYAKHAAFRFVCTVYAKTFKHFLCLCGVVYFQLCVLGAVVHQLLV